MKLIIAEKPELARNIARAVCGASGDKVRLPFRSADYTVVACAGHLLQLEPPDEIDYTRWGKPWREEVLPILPEPWPKRVTRGKENLVDTIQECLDHCDSVIHAGDPDDEGQLIVDEVLDFLGYSGPVERVLVNDNIDKNIRRAFENLDDNERHRGAGRAANARGIADFAFGVSESRLATLRAGHGTMLSIGRVQTPTLGLVVRRDEDIANHVAKTYYLVKAGVRIDGEGPFTFNLKAEKDLLDEDGRLSDKEAAERVKDSLTGIRETCLTKIARKRTPCPLPYNLTDLTADMSKRYKMSAKRVMEATQRLRDDFRAITYNRSDCQYLPVAALDDAEATLRQALGNIGANWELDYSLRPRCFDDSKIDAHTGIIPQEIAIDLKKLSVDEKRVYAAIVERYALQFAGDEVADISESCIEVDSGTLVHKAKNVVEAGWRRFGDDGAAQKGFDGGWIDGGAHDAEVVASSVEEKKTKPSAPYTEGTLVKDMANATKYLADPQLKDVLRRKDEGKPGEHGSIGTTATRAAIIETLKTRGFIEERGGRLLSTKLGRELYHACPPEIAGVDTTAKWWLIQEKVAAGEVDEYAVARDVCRVYEEHKDTAWAGVNLSSASYTVIGTCPLCGMDVIDKGPKKKSYVCSSNQWTRDEDGEPKLVSGCGFIMSKRCFGKKLSLAQVRTILSGGSTDIISGLVGKSGKEFAGSLYIDDKKTGHIGVKFDNSKGKKSPSKGSFGKRTATPKPARRH